MNMVLLLAVRAGVERVLVIFMVGFLVGTVVMEEEMTWVVIKGVVAGVLVMVVS